VIRNEFGLLKCESEISEQLGYIIGIIKYPEPVFDKVLNHRLCQQAPGKSDSAGPLRMSSVNSFFCFFVSFEGRTGIFYLSGP